MTNIVHKLFASRHTGLFAFMQKRISIKSPYGLPLTSFIFAFVLATAFFVGFIQEIIHSKIIISADTSVKNLLVPFQSAELTKVFLWITLLGKSKLVALYAIVVAILMWIWKKRSFIIPFFISIAGSGLFVFIGKIIVQRPRPEMALYIEKSFSFPSGHATVSMAFYGFIAYYIIRNAKQLKYKISAFFACAVMIIIIGFSRLYLGAHYISDVFGGYLVGATWLIIAISISEYFLSKKWMPEKSLIDKDRSTAFRITTLLLIISVGFYILYGTTQ